MTSAYIQRNPAMTPEEVLKMDEVVSWRTEMEQNISNSAKKLEVLRPKFREIEAILSSCGC